MPRENEELNDFNLTFLHYRDKTHLRNYTNDTLTTLVNTVKPRHVTILPELAIPTGELVRHLTQLPLEAARQKLNALFDFTDAGHHELAQVARKAGAGHVPLPEIEKTGIRSRIRAWAAHDAILADAFRTAFTQSYDAGYKTAIESLVRARLDTTFGAILEQALHEATYRTIYTGLVAVIDL